MPARLSDEELLQFGVSFADEGTHRFDPTIEWWNESWFWDWFDAEARTAGHCRVGLHPNQRRAWIWYYHFSEGEWLAVEETRLPIGDLRLADPETARKDDAQTVFAYEGFGLSFSWEATTPLRSGRLRFAGFGRVITGPRAGMILPLGADLRVEAIGAAHSLGRARAPGHESERFPASRFEQPIALTGSLRAGEMERPFAGRGERDHSWGPRHWNLEWTFLVLNGEHLRLQCAEARIPNLEPMRGGYLAREETISIRDARFDFEYRDDDLVCPVAGTFEATAEDGTHLRLEVEPLAATEIDITHTFVPPQRSVYRRALVRARGPSGGPPLLGWVEFNRFPRKRS
jgi:hypothetical protein